MKGNRSNVEFDEWPRFRMQTFPINSRYFNLSYQSSIPKLVEIKERFETVTAEIQFSSSDEW